MGTQNQEGTQEPVKQGDKLMLIAGCILGAVIIACLASIYWRMHTPIDREKLGQIGDYYGGLLNPIIALATVGLVFITLHIQREELKATQKELDRTRATTEEQNLAIRRQVFEQSFFSLFNKYQDLVATKESKYLKASYEQVFHRETLEAIAQKHLADIPFALMHFQQKDIIQPDGAGQIIHEYRKLWSDHNLHRMSYFSLVFTALHQLLYWIDSQPHTVIGESDKRQFVQIVRTYTTPIEQMHLLLYIQDRRDRYLPRLINKYGFFRQLASGPFLKQDENYPALFYTQYMGILNDHLDANDPYRLDEQQAFGRPMRKGVIDNIEKFDAIDPMEY